jgi:hypothetical protein
MVLPHRIELWTSPLPRGCSTTELRQRRRERISDHAGDVERSSLPAAGPGFIPFGHDGRKRQIRRSQARRASEGGAARQPQAPQGAGKGPRAGGRQSGHQAGRARFRRNYPGNCAAQAERLVTLQAVWPCGMAGAVLSYRPAEGAASGASWIEFALSAVSA